MKTNEKLFIIFMACIPLSYGFTLTSYGFVKWLSVLVMCIITTSITLLAPPGK